MGRFRSKRTIRMGPDGLEVGVESFWPAELGWHLLVGWPGDRTGDLKDEKQADSRARGRKDLCRHFRDGRRSCSGTRRFCAREKLAAAHFTAIGALRDLTLGYFDWEKKDYKRIPLCEQVEVLSLIGDITLDEKGKHKVHAHIVVGLSDGTARGGHLLEAHVRPTLEVILVESPAHLQRRFDSESGLALIRL